MSRLELKTLQKFKRGKPFMIVEMDKNIGCSIISSELCNSLANQILHDTKTYIKINSDS